MSEESQTLPAALGRVEGMVTRVREAPRSVWIWFGLWAALGVYNIVVETVLYGVLFVGVGGLYVWSQLRTPTDQEAIAAEDGLVPLLWADWMYLGGLVGLGLYGLLVVNDAGALGLVLFMIPLLRERSAQLD